MRPTDALGNEPFVSCVGCVGREQGHSRGRAGALLIQLVGACARALKFVSPSAPMNLDRC